MQTAHDDLPHPVPPLAYLRWKENYFFILLDVKANVFGVAHFVSEPIFNRLRISANLNIAGTQVRYAKESPFPADFGKSNVLSDGQVTLTVVKSHARFRLEIHTDEADCDLQFDGRLPSFDFAACKYAAPDIPSFKEVMTLGTNLPFEHFQQSMALSGTARASKSGQAITLDGLGYRDHSWCMRTDNIVLDHTWCGLNFPNRAFGIMTIRTLVRPGVSAREGYVADADGTRALVSIEVEQVRNAGGDTEQVIHRVTDFFGTKYTIRSDIAQRFSHVPLESEKSDGKAVYEITENFVRSVVQETGEEGVSLVELGRSSAAGGMKS